MKIFTTRLCGLVGFMAVAISLHVGAAEFTCEVRQRNCLYDAVAAANQTSEPDIIRFSKGVHDSDMPHTLGCAPSIVGDITIIGAGRFATYLFGLRTCAFFHIPAGSSLTLRDIQIAGGQQNGRRGNPGMVQRGAAVYNEGLLHIERSNFTSNDIVENDVFLSGGGAIYNASGATANLDDVGFHDNRVGPQNYGGAAILNEGVMTVTRSRFNENGGEGGYGATIANGVPGISTGASLLISDSFIGGGDGTGIHNHATLVVERTTIRDGDAAEGGGIYNGGEMTVRESAIIRNTAIKGGGIYSAEGATSNVINTTISHNHARGKVEGNGIGGGVYNYGGTVNLANVTIASNTSQGWGAAIAATSDYEGSAYIYMKSTLIVGHTNPVPCYDFGPNDLPKLFLVENNLITEESNCYAPSASDIVVPEATTFTEVIGPLGDYGGSTPGYALLPGSPAIDNEENVCTDFEGFPILIDQHGNARTGCDIGAVDSTVETPPVALQLLLTDNQTGIQPGSTGTMILVMLSRTDSTNPFEPIWDVDRSTLRLGSAGATPFKYTRIDLNEDGIHDLVMRFNINETGLACGDTTIDLQGTMVGGAEFVARADIVTVGCGEYLVSCSSQGGDEKARVGYYSRTRP